jgi:predicted O-linked N-acetylglucosamine transferase (SPINDLY family)
MSHHREGRLDLADESYRRVLSNDPKNATAWYLRSVVAVASDDDAQALKLLVKAVALAPDNAVFLCNLGDTYRRLDRVDEAIATLRRAVEAKPDLAEAWYNLGLALHDKGELNEAIVSYDFALGLKPELGLAGSRLVRALTQTRQHERAIAEYRARKGTMAESAQLHAAVADALAETWRRAYNGGAAHGEWESRLDEAIIHFRRAIEIVPQSPEVHSNLAAALHDRGHLDETLVHLRKAVELTQAEPTAHSNLLFLLAFDPACDAATILAEARRWQTVQAAHLVPDARPYGNARDPARRIRIGYVSPNFRGHCQALYILPLLRNHDRSSFEIFGYSFASKTDALTDKIREQCDVWRDFSSLSNEEAARCIREDQIDVLIDITMHMGENRALLFARKPAPVQICWLAYPGTTGLSAMDYRITDVHLDPPGSDDGVYTEKSIRLPDSFWVYDPLCEIAVNPLPALTNGHVTFGSLNTFRKMNELTLDLWAPLLRSLPDSRLLLLAPPGEARSELETAFRRRGVEAERLEFVPIQGRQSYLETYRRIDLGLDPLPANGHTTSLDAFWMGVPVVTMVGSTVLGRAGLCLAKNLGLPELVAFKPDEFVSIAADLARDLPRLAELRQELRGRMERSPLMDAPRFARNLENAYRFAWAEWCRSGLPPPNPAPSEIRK